MKTITLPRNLVVKVDDEDYERLSAVQVNYRSKPLRWQATYNSLDKKRGKFTWYATKTIDYKKWRMHRYIYFLRGIDITGKEIDHKNGDGLDNRFSNLRIATSSQQKTSRSVRADSKSGYKGVEFQKQNKNWCAYIIKNGKKTHLGVFATPAEAALAYNRAAIDIWGEYAWTNRVKRTKLSM